MCMPIPPPTQDWKKVEESNPSHISATPRFSRPVALRWTVPSTVLTYKKLAETEGFEPSHPIWDVRFSKPLPSPLGHVSFKLVGKVGLEPTFQNYSELQSDLVAA